MPSRDEAPVSARVAIVGAGPAGLYAAHALGAALGEDFGIDVFERWPTPFGLLRFGVAPDALSIKQTARWFERVLAAPGLRYWGNVQVGRDLGVRELRQHYHQVLLATGAPLGRRLGIRGESLPGSIAANQMIGWYNAHPEHGVLAVQWRQVRTMVVVGMGNTALDVTRVLLTRPEQMVQTDMADVALAALAQSQLRRVVLLARRGAAQAAFDPRELERLAALPDLAIEVEPRELEFARELDTSPTLAALGRVASRSSPGSARTVSLRFRLAPLEIVGERQVEAIRVEHRRPDVGGWHGTGETELIPADLVLSAAGFRGEPLDEVPFDTRTGVVPSEGGRVDEGLYVTGWLRRGARGLLGSTKADTYDTVEHMLEGLPRDGARRVRPTRDLLAGLAGRGVRVVGREDWQRIDEHELERGRAVGRPRRKFASVAEMLAALAPSTTVGASRE